MQVKSPGQFAVESQSNKIVLPRLKITWVVAMFSGPRNYPTSIVEVIQHLAKRGNEVTVLGFKPKNVSMFEETRVNLVFIPLSYVSIFSPLLFALASALLLPFVLIRNRSSVVFFQPDVSLVASLPTVFAFRLLKKKFFLDIRSPPVETSGFQGFVQRFSFRMSVSVAKRTVDGLTIITNMMKKEICADFGIDPSVVGVWTSGVNIEHFDSDSTLDSGKELRKNLGLEGKFVVFYHGVLSENRGVFETVKSVGLLVHDYPQIVFFILGEGPVLGRLKEYVKDGGLGDNVFFHGRVSYSEVPKYIAMADVCIVPLPNHPFWNSQSPLKLLEYLSMHKAIILSDIPAHRSVVAGDMGALWIKSVEPRAIADLLVFAFQNRTSLPGYGEGAFDFVKDNYSWDRVSENLERFLLTI